ncbi:MAG: SUMF1/EgtB/PvdO family nonheme iron enzyme [Deltaproteobacteria bacterium]|nr:SUMF1/EgtB/PvdO family nonheme iron enzyme [Deltaproteobacteria bacterium]
MVTRKRAIAYGIVLAIGSSLAACGAPELTYRDGELIGPDASADADGSNPPDAIADQQVDGADAQPDANEAGSDGHEAGSDASDGGSDGSEGGSDGGDGGTDVAEGATDALDATTDPASEPPEDGAEAGPEASPDAPADITTDPVAQDAIDDQQDSGFLCPVGMGSVPKATSGSYCIDTTEVRQADWAAWLATNPSTGGQVAECTTNTSFAPDTAGACASAYNPGTTPDRPVVCVDWCDAVAYCSAHGKRLCGNVAGGAMAFASFTDASFDQWHRACSLGGSRAYPYGAGYVAGTCTDSASASSAVGSKAACEGGFPGIFDMSGNVSEWEYSCNGTNVNSRCRLRGGSYADTGAAVACAAAADDKRLTRSPTIGLRCCSY